MRILASVVAHKFPLRTAAVITLAVFTSTATSQADDYATIARAVASPLASNFDDLKKTYTDGQAMLRTELARQILETSHSVAADLIAPRQNMLVQLEYCRRSMQEIRRLDSKTPDFESLAKKSILASPALIRTDPATGKLQKQDSQAVGDLIATAIVEAGKAIADAWNASSERETYSEHYRLARQESLPLADIAKQRCKGVAPVGYGVGVAIELTGNAAVVDEAIAGGPAAKAGIRKGDEIVAVNGRPTKNASQIDRAVLDSLSGPRDSTVKLNYSRGGKTTTVELPRSYSFPIDIFDMDFNGSWNAIFQYDRLSLQNISGAALINCTLRVTLVGTHGDSDTLVQRQHLHYVDAWPAGDWRHATYRSSSANGIATAESIDRVQRLLIEVYSDQFRHTITYQYAGTKAFDDDMREYVGLIEKHQKFTLSFIDDGVFTDAGVSLQHDGTFRFIPDPKLKVTLKRGNDVRTVVFSDSGKTWRSGFLAAYALKSDTFNGLNPDRAEVEIEFPGSPKKISLSWNRSNK